MWDCSGFCKLRHTYVLKCLLVKLFSSQILLISDVLYSFLEYQYDLKNGLPRALDENGHPVTVKLSWNSQFILHQNGPFICVIYHYILSWLCRVLSTCTQHLKISSENLRYTYTLVELFLSVMCIQHTLGFSRISDLYTLIEQSINQYMALSLC